MKSEQFDTSTVPITEQFNAWSDWFAGIFDATPLDMPIAGFPANCEVWTMNGYAVTRSLSPPIRMARTRTLIHRNPVDHWAISLGCSATNAVSAGDRSIDVPRGVPFVQSLRHEVVGERAADPWLDLYLSRDSFSEIAPTLDAACGSIVSTPLGALFADYLLLLEQHLPSLASEDMPGLREALSVTVSACLAPSPDKLERAADQIDMTRLEKVRYTVQKHLRSPALGPRLLCRHVGTSRSQLYRLMERNGGVARYILQQRLLAVYAALSDPSCATPVAALADEFCFADASCLSRAFRKEFDATPGDLRASARAGVKLAPKLARATAPIRFIDILKTI